MTRSSAEDDGSIRTESDVLYGLQYESEVSETFEQH
jgi:hypothetical protein